jgi:1,4-alpha-glucan branching enzyme
MSNKTTENNQASPFGITKPRPVRLEFLQPTAKSVSIAGTFNDWRPGATEMVLLGEGRWVKELVLAPGVYEYRLVVDGQWLVDPRARETVTNPFGELNSVLKVNGCAC